MAGSASGETVGLEVLAKILTTLTPGCWGA